MNVKGEIFATAAAAALAIGLGGGVSAQDTTKGLTVDVALGVIDYYFVASDTPVDFGEASITGLDGETLTGSATVYLVDALLAPGDNGFQLTVDINAPFTSGANTFPAGAAELVDAHDPELTTTVTYPSSGSLSGVLASTASGSLADPGRLILTGADGANVQLEQNLDLEVNVPADTLVGTYTTTLVLTGVESNP